MSRDESNDCLKTGRGMFRRNMSEACTTFAAWAMLARHCPPVSSIRRRADAGKIT
jgi:hypothetical protein